jgi:hypothetical protein
MVARMVKNRNACKLLVGKLVVKRPLGISRCMLVNNTKMDLTELGWGGVGWIDLAQDRDEWRALVNMVMNFWVPYHAGKFLISCTTGSLSSSPPLHRIIISYYYYYYYCFVCVYCLIFYSCYLALTT